MQTRENQHVRIPSKRRKMLAQHLSRGRGCWVDAERNDTTVIQAVESFRREFFSLGSVVNRRCALQHSPSYHLPEHAFSQRLLRHAPRIECAERTNDVRHSGTFASPRGRDGRMVEDCMNVDHIELPYVRTEP